MNIQVIHEHSVDLDLLPAKALILDAGCRGMDFTNHFRKLGHAVASCDVGTFEGKYVRLALVANRGLYRIIESEDKQATRIEKQNESNKHLPVMYGMTIADFEQIAGRKFDLIKLDIEGEEYNIIMSLDSPPSKQISLEMHLHTGIYGMNEAKEMENKLLSLGYISFNHELTDRHGAGKNFWDSLWVLK